MNGKHSGDSGIFLDIRTRQGKSTTTTIPSPPIRLPCRDFVILALLSILTIAFLRAGPEFTARYAHLNGEGLILVSGPLVEQLTQSPNSALSGCSAPRQLNPSGSF